MPCDGSIMTSALQDRRFRLPSFALNIPLRWKRENVQEYAIAELPLRAAPAFSPRLNRNEDPARTLLGGGFTRPDGSAAFVYWTPAEILTSTYEATMTFESSSLSGEARLIDLLDGTIYAIPASMEEEDGRGYRRFLHLPLRDSPLLLTFGDFVK